MSQAICLADGAEGEVSFSVVGQTKKVRPRLHWGRALP
jgi:hypothetical protein